MDLAHIGRLERRLLEARSKLKTATDPEDIEPLSFLVRLLEQQLRRLVTPVP